MPAPLPPSAKEEVDLGNYFAITYRELFKAHVLDVHLPNMLIGISASVEVPLVTILGRRIHATFSEIADFITVSALSRTVVDIPIGIIVEYVGVRNVMFLCLLMNIVSSVIGFNVVSAPTLYAFCLLSGLSLGGFFLSRHIFVAGISSKKYRGLLMAILSGLLRWSHVIGPLASGLFASYLGDVKYSFILAAITSGIALTTLAIATYSPGYQHMCENSCSASVTPSASATPQMSDDEDAAEGEEKEGAEGGAGEAAVLSTPLLPPASAAAEGVKYEGSSPPPQSTAAAAASDHRVIVGAETIVTLPMLPAAQLNRLHARHHVCGPASSASAGPDGSTSITSVTSIASLHPDIGASGVHHFGVQTLWCTIVDYWTVIWRLGLYIIFATAIRANRKLLISFAGMRASMTDAQVSYLMSFSFVFDALLFPLGGIVMDTLGRQYAMVPVAVGLGVVFFFLPLATTEVHLYIASSAFGVVDALGCGLLMTLTADRAPPQYGAPFFGIMRTVQDLGHVVGARGVSTLMRYAGFNACCWTLTVTGFLTAAWGVYGVPLDSDVPAETPRLERAAVAHERHHRHAKDVAGYSQSSEETTPLTGPVSAERRLSRVLSPPAVAGAASYGTTMPPQPQMPRRNK